MKIIQVNAWLGRLASPLKSFLDDEDADIACLQEILSSSVNNSLFDQFSSLEMLQENYPYVFFSPTFAFYAYNQKIEMGNAILSKHPITNQQTVFTHGEHVDDRTTTDGLGNIRNLQSCSVQLPSGDVSVVNHHAYHDTNPLGNEKSLEAIKIALDHIATLDSPLIVCGDFNVSPESKVVSLIEETLDVANLTKDYSLETTLSSVFRHKDVKVAADYVFTSSSITATSFTASDRVISDHKALVAELEIT